MTFDEVGKNIICKWNFFTGLSVKRVSRNFSECTITIDGIPLAGGFVPTDYITIDNELLKIKEVDARLSSPSMTIERI